MLGACSLSISMIRKQEVCSLNFHIQLYVEERKPKDIRRIGSGSCQYTSLITLLSLSSV